MAETFEAYRNRVLSYLGDEEPIGVQQATPTQLERRLRDVAPEELIRRPAPEKWSIAEIVAHLADAELAMGWRLRNMLLDASRVTAACHAQGALLVLDVSQSCGAVPMNVNGLGADFLVCAAYKWLLSSYGTGFFWAKSEHLDTLRPRPFYWMGQIADTFSTLNFVDPKSSRSARRWDAAEASTYFNFNLTAMDASVDFVLRVGPEFVLEHNRKLIAFLFERLPREFVPASPLDPAQRGPYGCFTARTPEKTAELYQKLRKENVVVSMREGRIRVSPHLFNSERDIDRLINVLHDDDAEFCSRVKDDPLR